ncbi:spore wall protein 25-like [Vairimorpha necatrix]|uniref:Spore wall protein 25-like n=1 Tax=Vairimorpha necatrix TaxID=6039 RepID=A0AAX4JGW3_9MICR
MNINFLCFLNILLLIKTSDVLSKENKVTVKTDEVVVQENKVAVENDEVLVQEDKTTVKNNEVVVKDDKTVVLEGKTVFKDDKSLIKAAEKVEENPSQLVSDENHEDRDAYNENVYVTLTDFVDKISNLMSIQYDWQKEVLIMIFTTFYGQAGVKTLLYTAAGLHNTSNFTVLVDPNDSSKYRSRGLLQIQHESNYRTLTFLSNKVDYLSNPDQLEALSQSVIGDTVKFYEYMLRDTYTFRNYVRVMGLGDYDHIKDRPDIVNFEKIFTNLKKLFRDVPGEISKD